MLLNRSLPYRYKSVYEKDKRFDMKKLLESRTMREFERNLVKPCGYVTYEDYHQDCKFDSKLDHIRVPTLYLNAGDDMFSPKRGALWFQVVYVEW